VTDLGERKGEHRRSRFWFAEELMLLGSGPGPRSGRTGSCEADHGVKLDRVRGDAGLSVLEVEEADAGDR
jgi:hypothetical protein